VALRRRRPGGQNAGLPASPLTDHPKLYGLALHNPCNIRRQNLVDWRGACAQQPSPDFLAFVLPEWGIRAAARVLLAAWETRGIRTVAGILDHWARSHGRRGADYEGAILRLTGWRADWAPDLRDPAVMRSLLRALIEHEARTQPYADAVIDRAMHLAGLDVPGQPDHEETAA